MLWWNDGSGWSLWWWMPVAMMALMAIFAVFLFLRMKRHCLSGGCCCGKSGEAASALESPRRP
jgi:hypothetical protein